MKSLYKFMFATAAFLLANAAGAQAPLAALSQIEPGQYALTAPGTQPRSICLGDPRTLLQLQHSGAACSRYVISNEKDSTVVHYTCPGLGHGRTEVKVETPRLLQIQSQGIANNAPFDWSLEARRTGACMANSQRQNQR